MKLLPLREDEIYVYEGVLAGAKVVIEGLIDPIDGKVVDPVIKEIDAKLSAKVKH